VVDGFAGAGRYSCGAGGSPVIFIEELRAATTAVNLYRASQNLPPLEVECLLVLNDQSAEAIELLKNNCAPLLAEIKEGTRQLHISAHYITGEFESSYGSTIKQMIAAGGYRSVLFNLDQCGYSQVRTETISEVMRSTSSAEIFLTYAIQTLLTYMMQNNPDRLVTQLRHLGVSRSDVGSLDGLVAKDGFLGAAEKLVFERFFQCALFVSPFSIHNPEGWRYWLIHFANSYRARQVYNDVLHDNKSFQAHFGKSGLDMLAYDPKHEGALYLFDDDDRSRAKHQLVSDIPRFVNDCGDAINIGDFYAGIYNATAAHSDDVHAAIMDCEDLEVLTPTGGQRRKANTIEIGDTLRLKTQRSFFPMFTRKT